MAQASQDRRAKSGGITVQPRNVLAAIIVVLVILFVVLNRHHTRISFIFFHAYAATWIALLISAAAGFLIGVLVSKRRARARERS